MVTEKNNNYETCHFAGLKVFWRYDFYGQLSGL